MNKSFHTDYNNHVKRTNYIVKIKTLIGNDNFHR